jgi:hypothetical protein
MVPLTDKQLATYLLRCYMAVDGLWFMKLEETLGFDTALEIDNKVWKVMPKINSRTLKALLKLEKGMEALFVCFTTKLALEGYVFETEKSENPQSFKVIVNKCPWYDVLIKSGREKIAERVCTLICHTTCTTWTPEFGDDIKFEIQAWKCRGSDYCVLQFSR